MGKLDQGPGSVGHFKTPSRGSQKKKNKERQKRLKEQPGKRQFAPQISRKKDQEKHTKTGSGGGGWGEKNI